MVHLVAAAQSAGDRVTQTSLGETNSVAVEVWRGCKLQTYFALRTSVSLSYKPYGNVLGATLSGASSGA